MTSFCRQEKCVLHNSHLTSVHSPEVYNKTESHQCTDLYYTALNISLPQYVALILHMPLLCFLH